MAVRALFIDGPMDGDWKALQDLIPEIRVAKRSPIDLFGPREVPVTAEVAIVKGTYVLKTHYSVSHGEETKAYYVWQGWDDELQEVQESEGR